LVFIYCYIQQTTTPYVSISSPENASSFIAPAVIAITVNAIDNDGQSYKSKSIYIWVQEVTAVSIENSEMLSLYPNPVSGELKLNLNKDFSGNSFLILYNCLGSIIMEETLSGSEHILDIKDLPNGVYFITLTSEQGKIIKKIIKN